MASQPETVPANVTATIYPSIIEFLSIATEPLYQREWPNSIPLGIYPSYLSASTAPPRQYPLKPGESPETFILISTNEGLDHHICLVATKTPSYGALSVYSAVPPEFLDISAHITVLVDALFSERDVENIPRAYNGDSRLSLPMANSVAARLGLKVKIEERYTAAVLTAETISPDIPRQPLPVDHDIRRMLPGEQTGRLVEMYRGMFQETRGIIVSEEAAKGVVEKAVGRGEVWGYFVAGEVVSSALLGRPTRTGKSVTNVFCRQEFRRRRLTQALMDEIGRRLVLDEGLGYLGIFFLEGGTASRIYRRTGFCGEEWGIMDFVLAVDLEG